MNITTHLLESFLLFGLHNPMNCIIPGLPVPHHLPDLPKFMSTTLVTLSSHLILCCPLFFLPSIFPSIRVFSMSRLFASGNQSIGASASASVLPMSIIQSWFPLVLNWFDLLAAQETIKSLLQHHSSKTSIPQHSAFSTTIMASFLLIYPPENLQSIYMFFISLFNCYTFL